MSGRRPHSRLGLFLQQFAQCRHCPWNDLPARRHVARSSQKYGLIAIAGQARRLKHARSHERLKELQAPQGMIALELYSGPNTLEDVARGFLYCLERLQVATCRQRVSIIAVGFRGLSIPTARTDSFN